MQTFSCCGFDRNTDSYQLQPCIIDLNQNPFLLTCKEAMQTYLEIDVYPIAKASIALGFFEVLILFAHTNLICFVDCMHPGHYDHYLHIEEDERRVLRKSFPRLKIQVLSLVISNSKHILNCRTVHTKKCHGF